MERVASKIKMKEMNGWGKMKVKTIGRKEVKGFRVHGIERINYMFSRVMLYCSNNPKIPVVTHSHISCTCKIVSWVLSKMFFLWSDLESQTSFHFWLCISTCGGCSHWKVFFLLCQRRSKKIDVVHWLLNASAQKWYHFHSPFHQLELIRQPHYLHQA